jgi:thymidylate synthase
VSEGRVVNIKVIRGAPCGATWEAAKRLEGVPADEAVVRMGLETQFFCSANPAGWDPIYGKSPVHFAGDVHSMALSKALDRIKGIGHETC